jgi:hypothetical protein
MRGDVDKQQIKRLKNSYQINRERNFRVRASNCIRNPITGDDRDQASTDMYSIYCVYTIISIA